jgi:hypothetical protein
MRLISELSDDGLGSNQDMAASSSPSIRIDEGLRAL